MALAAYQTAVQNLIQPLQAPLPLISAATLTVFINQARQKVAAEGQCVRAVATLNTVATTQSYAFSGFTGLPTGIARALTVRKAFIQLGGGKSQELDLRDWEYYLSYWYGTGDTGTPQHAGQLGQGTNGTLYLHPIPNGVFAINLDVAALPVPLVDDTTPELIPDLWTDAIPFYAAWLAMLNQQRAADADMMFARYDLLLRRAQQVATPTALPGRADGGMGAAEASRHMPVTGAGGAAATMMRAA